MTADDYQRAYDDSVARHPSGKDAAFTDADEALFRADYTTYVQQNDLPQTELSPLHKACAVTAMVVTGWLVVGLAVSIVWQGVRAVVAA